MHKILMRPCALILVGISSISFSAHAFHLDDHERITRQAHSEFIKCFPQYQTQIDVESLVSGDLSEDTNLIEKELYYSHYYNPHKKLKMWRGDSADRIENLKPDLLQCRISATQWDSDSINELGHAVHHFQDMAVPAHVVPIKHSFWDGFETYQFQGDISSEWSCAQISAAKDDELEKVLNETADATLKAIENYRVESVSDATHQTHTLTGKDYWLESSGDDFGDYGSAGNNFGVMTFAPDDQGDIEVSDQAYRMFKQQQMKLAVRATLRGLAWAFKP